MTPRMTPTRRRVAYRVFTAVVPLASAYGLVAEETGPLWVALFAALFIGPLADANVPQAPDAGRHEAVTPG